MAVSEEVTRIEFRAEPEYVEAIRLQRPWAKRHYDLIDAFEFPVRIRINGVDFVGVQNKPWSEMSLVWLAVSGRQAIETLDRPATATVSDADSPWQLQCVSTGKFVRVARVRDSRETTITFDDLRVLWRGFNREVGDFLYSAFPELKQHHRWTPRFAGWFPFSA